MRSESTRFANALSKHTHRRVKLDALLAYVRTAFPHLDGWQAEERLAVVLAELEEEGVIQYPSERNKQNWVVRRGTTLPTWVTHIVDEGADEEQARFDWRAFRWHPDLYGVRALRHPSEKQLRVLRTVHELLGTPSLKERMPRRTRSLQVAGDEKELDGLRKRQVWGEGLLNEGLLNISDHPNSLTAQIVPTPMATGRALVFENEQPYLHALDHALRRPKGVAYDLLVFGAGFVFPKAIAWIPRLHPTITNVEYIGDLDRSGLHHLSSSMEAGERLGLTVEPAVHAHQHMLQLAETFGFPEGRPNKRNQERDEVDPRLGRWFDESMWERIESIVLKERGIPEEVLPFRVDRVLERV